MQIINCLNGPRNDDNYITIIKIKSPLYNFLSNLLVSASHDQVPQHCPCWVDSSSVTNGDEECMHTLSGQ